jgi:hypothetical protein
LALRITAKARIAPMPGQEAHACIGGSIRLDTCRVVYVPPSGIAFLETLL